MGHKVRMGDERGGDQTFLDPAISSMSIPVRTQGPGNSSRECTHVFFNTTAPQLEP